MSTPKILAASITIAALLFVALMYWYDWSGRPLSSAEVDEYMARIEAQTQEPGARHDLSALWKFLDTDDGKPFYTVNLYNFHEVAKYPEESDFTGSGEDAYDRFSSVMISLMTRRGSHPVYGSNWADEASSNWDRIVIVRYRSRRDLVDLFATEAFADASLHKWASLRDHDRMLVQAMHIPEGRYVIMIVALLVGIAACVFGQILFNRRS